MDHHARHAQSSLDLVAKSSPDLADMSSLDLAAAMSSLDLGTTSSLDLAAMSSLDLVAMRSLDLATALRAQLHQDLWWAILIGTTQLTSIVVCHGGTRVLGLGSD